MNHVSYFPTIPAVFLLAGVAFAALAMVVWIAALVDCLRNEPSEGNDKVIWLLVIILLHGLGALLYLFIRRPQRISRYGQ